MEFLKDSHWVWCGKWSSKDKEQPRVVFFRREIDIEDAPVSSQVKISADSRYKLYVNGKLAEVGPSKGDKQIWFYDEVELTPYLKKGKNIIAVWVLRYPEDTAKGNHSTFRTSTPGLYLTGGVKDAQGKIYDFSADTLWRCKKEEGFSIVAEEEQFAPLYIHENVVGNPETFGWMQEDFDSSKWERVKPYIRLNVPGSISPGNLNPRMIPFMYRKRRTFARMMDLKKTEHSKEEWNAFLLNKQEIIIAPNSEEIVEIDAAEEMTGYLKIAFTGGKNAKVEILQSESYIYDELCGPAQVPAKGNRCDKENGHLDGYTDVYQVAGVGSDKKQEVYEPFWFRTFRFIQLKITTQEEPLHIKSFDYEETGYPLEVISSVETSDASHGEIWEISERTLRRCMHETYEDCPFYEQLQYAMDSRAQILYTYAVSADDRLARKCMDDFKRAQRYDGLLNCCYPNCNVNVIPGFSIYYIFMVYDHMMYFGNRELVKYHMPTIEGILGFFDRHLTEEGYVGSIGGILMNAPFWSFIDWAESWNPTTGMPPAGVKGPITMESLLYIMGLQHAADLKDYLGKHEDAEEYRDQAVKVQKAIRRYCVGADGMIQDGPGVPEYSQHGQVFAILTDTVDIETGRNNLLKTVLDKSYAQCTVAMRYYLFRALEKVNLYEYTDQYWDSWRTMIANRCTTCVESESYARSECHAWGALALYELPSIILGVRPAAPGYKIIQIKPVPGYLTYARGIVKTPVGEVTVSWEMKNNKIQLIYNTPEGIEVIVDDNSIYDEKNGNIINNKEKVHE